MSNKEDFFNTLFKENLQHARWVEQERLLATTILMAFNGVVLGYVINIFLKDKLSNLISIIVISLSIFMIIINVVVLFMCRKYEKAWKVHRFKAFENYVILHNKYINKKVDYRQDCPNSPWSTNPECECEYLSEYCNVPVGYSFIVSPNKIIRSSKMLTILNIIMIVTWFILFFWRVHNFICS